MNPFRKYLTKEQLLQEACVNYLRLQYPNLLFTHVPNEGKKSPFERWLYKLMGVRTGISDLLIFQTNQLFNGFAIELKIDKNKPTELQEKFMEDIRFCGWKTLVIYDLNTFINNVKEYIGQ